MIGRFFTVGGLTLLSRLTGFARDIVLAAVLGAGPIADAFFVALRLPNHFRAIFTEGAFNAAFVPAYARIRQQEGSTKAQLFSDRVFTLLFASQIVLLLCALAFTPDLIKLLAPGFGKDPGRFALAVELTRITFPYLLLVSLVTLYGGILNALARFAAAAAAPILLYISMMTTLLLSGFFATPGHAAAWGVLLAGILELLLVGGDTLRQGVLAVFRWPQWEEDVKRFFKALLPATVGSAGLQIALFADTIIASFLSAGALSALYYADRLNQLPIGVIGIAAGDERGARHVQARAIEFTLLLSIPCIVAFLLLPDLIMRALFMRGAFTATDALTAGHTLAAYAVGLLPFVLVRSVTATFLARGDTATPVKASLLAVAVNVAFKIVLMAPLAQVGLALATSIGAWLNLVLVAWFAARADHLALDARLGRSLIRLAVAGGALALVLWLPQGAIARMCPSAGDVGTLAVLAATGAVVYGGFVAAFFGAEWLVARGRRR